jgi:hypothetical protein
MTPAALWQAESLRLRQGRELAALDREQGKVPSLSDLRQINALREQHGQLMKNLELDLPTPRPDDNARRYRVRILDELKRHSPKWRGVDISLIRSDAVVAEIVGDAKRVCDDVTVGSFRHPDRLRRVEVTDASGRRCIEWRGPRAFVDMFMPPVATTIVAFGDGKGRWWNTAGEIK